MTRTHLKKEFVKTNEAPDESQTGYVIALISSQLGQVKNDYLRQVISYDYSDNNWTKDNFKVREGYKDIVNELLTKIVFLSM